MSKPTLEKLYGSTVERGHCKCCCLKWQQRPKKKPGRVYKMDLTWIPTRSCSCSSGHCEKGK